MANYPAHTRIAGGPTVPATDQGLALQLRDYRLTTAEILYHMPDHPGILQSYIWQDYDLAPQFPILRKFLDFWSHNLDGKLHSIAVAPRSLIRPPQWRNVEDFLTLH
jgi:uncharacterized protein Usg